MCVCVCVCVCVCQSLQILFKGAFQYFSILGELITSGLFRRKKYIYSLAGITCDSEKEMLILTMYFKKIFEQVKYFRKVFKYK